MDKTQAYCSCLLTPGFSCQAPPNCICIFALPGHHWAQQRHSSASALLRSHTHTCPLRPQIPQPLPPVTELSPTLVAQGQCLLRWSLISEPLLVCLLSALLEMASSKFTRTGGTPGPSHSSHRSDPLHTIQVPLFSITNAFFRFKFSVFLFFFPVSL